jgi:hypothetical protein
VQRSRERVFLRIRSNLTSYCECVTSHRQASLVSDPDQRSHYPINLFVPPNPKLTVSQPTGCGFLGGSLPLCTIPHPHRRVFACTLTAAPGPGTAIVRLGWALNTTKRHSNGYPCERDAHPGQNGAAGWERGASSTLTIADRFLGG